MEQPSFHRAALMIACALPVLDAVLGWLGVPAAIHGGVYTATALAWFVQCIPNGPFASDVRRDRAIALVAGVAWAINAVLYFAHA